MSVSAGYELAEQACGIRDGGAIECWGQEALEVDQLPVSHAVDIDLDDHMACAAGLDGELTCWFEDGRSPDGLTQLYSHYVIPTDDIVSISLGWGSHMCGLHETGAVTCWGPTDNGPRTPPAGPFDAVTVGETHACGILSGGEGGLECWGEPPVDFVQDNLPALRSVSTERTMTFGITIDGQLLALHDDRESNQAVIEENLSALVGHTDVVQVSVAPGNACTLAANGSVACYGFFYSHPCEPT